MTSNYPFLILAGVNVDGSEGVMVPETVLGSLRFHYAANLRHYLSNNISGIKGSLQFREMDNPTEVGEEERECSRLLITMADSVHGLFEKTRRDTIRNFRSHPLSYDVVEQILFRKYREFVERHTFLEDVREINAALGEVCGPNNGDPHLTDAVRYSRAMLHNITYLETLGDFEFEEGSLAPIGDLVPHIRIPRLQA